MTHVRIEAKGASNKQLYREVVRLQQENQQMRGQLNHINTTLLRTFKKKKLDKIFAPPKPKKAKKIKKKVARVEQELKDVKVELSKPPKGVK